MTAGLQREHLEAMAEEKSFRARQREARDARIRTLARDNSVGQIARRLGLHKCVVIRALAAAGIHAPRTESRLAEGLPAS